MSPSGILVSDSAGSCQMNQSPTLKATGGSGGLTVTQNRQYSIEINPNKV